MTAGCGPTDMAYRALGTGHTPHRAINLTGYAIAKAIIMAGCGGTETKRPIIYLAWQIEVIGAVTAVVM